MTTENNATLHNGNHDSKTNKTMYGAAVGLTLVTGLALIWLSLGVGIIGADGDPANVMYFGVLAVGLIGAFIARFQAAGMTAVLIATAAAQLLVTLIALLAGLGQPYSPPLELLGLNGGFTALWLGAAWLFRKAASQKLL
ncbi:MAG: hypothetical protein KDE51_17595 [Anaerolineales bacterium]|nr:hypothetical protein [Anaerolineales bacterium]